MPVWHVPAMDLAKLVALYGGQTAFAKALGVDKSHINRVVKNRRPMAAALAVRIYRVTGKKLGPLADRQPAPPAHAARTDA